MKLIDFLNVLEDGTFLYVGVPVCGVWFETRRSADFFIDRCDKLSNRNIVKVYVEDGYLHVALEP